MTVKVTSQCRKCNAVSIDTFENENVSTFNTSNVNDFCTICEDKFKVISKVEDLTHKELNSDKKSILEIPENSFTSALLFGVIIAFCLLVFYFLGNPNW
jgi:hypothetical protein